jgi:outer membrane receptor for ferrienterochelin and colicins
VPEEGIVHPNLIADNYAYFFSNRTVQFGQLKPEIAWNYGVSLAYKFNLAFREGWIHVDFYRTDFERQLVVDLEKRDELNIYTANGKSFSNSLQAEVSYEVAEGFNVKFAYKWDNVKVNYKEGLAIQALKPQHKVLVVLDYNWEKPRLLFTANFVWYSKSRIPAVHADEHVHANYLYTLNMQITKKIKEQWEVYVGAENMLNQMQHNPILSAEQPFNKAFDATLIWGPIRGAMVYAGFRFVLK